MVDRDIPEEMVEKAAPDEQFAIIADHLVVNVNRCTCDGPFEIAGLSHRPECGYEPVMPLADLRALLLREGCAVVQLPEPDEVITGEPQGLRPQSRWSRDEFEVSGIASSWGPRVNVSGGAFLTAEQAEARVAILLAAAREARRLASGSGVGDHHG